MNWEEFKETTKHRIEHNINSSSEPLFDHEKRELKYKWTIGDGNQYDTKLQANVMNEIYKKGYLYVGTVLENIDVAKEIDALISRGLIKPKDSDTENTIHFEVTSLV